ncbi:hypothetical protein AQS8620_02586 [Aquimixticola soesokkakensis]|uniref:Uncharacterized protein n=1 Tax=Aquimixticola soesokkakensis TaxID=1519096 RepID=A0A1Y5T8P7_9RHOB|nr:hypothetical protein [Aquimixticola soesokkakensis]SLN57912.1 hypothetical protein AQS8620_02586 [Aquimixticola soesokkakensis]
MTTQYEDDKIIDAVYVEKDWREIELGRLAALPGATFASTFVKAIYDYAREDLSNRGNYYGWTERDREAHWPTALTNGYKIYSGNKLAAGFDDTPTPEQIKTAQLRSKQFLDGWKFMTGNDMKGGLLFAHARIEIGKGVSENFRDAAKELRDEGVTAFVDKQLQRGYMLSHAERDHRDMHQGRAIAPVKTARQKQRVR